MPQHNYNHLPNLFEAARSCDPIKVKQLITADTDLSLMNEYGFNALQCAAAGSNSCKDESNLIETLKTLIEAGSPLEAKSGDGRTALFLLAEFSPFVAPVQFMIDAGANADVSDKHGNHITRNAMMEEVQELLSQITGVALQEPEPEPEPVKMSSATWNKARKAIDKVFEELNGMNIIALADAGYTQSDAFADCSQLFHERENNKDITGFCFYTRQDLNTAKRSSQLYLGIWGAPDGNDENTIAIGEQVISVFEQHNFETNWNTTAGTRPCVLLYSFNA
ncbi:hypothetical protein ABDD95_21865 [Mucilaginibacter sp. PAMB04274]|uniref:ankyrin repeat domain-containing protein n=1 Tax=Mucilaginibacter sp. PAMB04274 TaxID=3138568 RepID=UPI0031F6BCB8